MKNCCECGKELKFWEGYHHLTLGKNEYVCWNCCKTLEENMENYRNFISPYINFFKQGEHKKNLNNSNIKL